MKKLRTYVALLCCLAVLQFPCQAETSTPTFSVNATSDSLEVDETVYLLVDLENNEGFGAAQFRLIYDADKLSFESATVGAVIPSGAITALNTDIVGEVNFSTISFENIEQSGTVLVVKFVAKEHGIARFDLQLLAYADSDGTSLNSTSNDTEIVIGTVETIVPEQPTETDTPSLPDEPEIPDEPIESDVPVKPVVPVKPTEPSVPDTPAMPDEPNVPDETTIPEEPIVPDVPAEIPKICFSDVTESHWAYEQISSAVNAGLFNGTGDGLFSPELPMTRAMFVTVLYRYAGSPEAQRAGFTDIEDSWYTDAVSWAAENGIVMGTGNNEFSPHKYITRGEIATILCRFKGGKSTTPDLLERFNDTETVPDWGRESIAWAVESGLIRGREGGLLAFADNATRAETAVIFTRFLGQ